MRAESAPPATWVLLRGLTRESRHWGGFPDTLRDALQRADLTAEVVAVDLPGNGSLHALRSPTRVEAMAEFCRDELRRRALTPPYGVLAMSLGAMVAVAWAAAHPPELRRCVLINTSLRPFCPFYRRLRPANYPTLLRLMLTAPTERVWEQSILAMTSRHLSRDAAAAAAVLDDWIAYRRTCTVTRANALRQLWAAVRYRAPERKPAPPTLVLASAGDTLVDMVCSLRLAQVWDCDLAFHTSAGHDLPLDDGPWVARQVAEWLRQEPDAI
jgi:pimeloyl-ACP methyl ester carboxylesterase